MKLLGIILLALILSGCGNQTVLKNHNSISRTGVDISNSVICLEDGCNSFADLLPAELTFVPAKQALPLCIEIEKGWCLKNSDTATSTLKGYFDDMTVEVRTIDLDKIKI